MRRLDPARDDAGVRLRTLRLRRRMSQAALAGLACVSPQFVSMVETGQRTLRRADHILALADALRVPPHYLADGWDDPLAPALRGPNTVPFPSQCDPVMLERHQQLARQFSQIAHTDTRAAGDWLRRLAHDPAINPWLLLDHLAAMSTQPGHREEPRMASAPSPARPAGRRTAVRDLDFSGARTPPIP